MAKIYVEDSKSKAKHSTARMTISNRNAPHRSASAPYSGEKFRFNSCLCPCAANCAASSVCSLWCFMVAGLQHESRMIEKARENRTLAECQQKEMRQSDQCDKHKSEIHQVGWTNNTLRDEEMEVREMSQLYEKRTKAPGARECEPYFSRSRMLKTRAAS